MSKTALIEAVIIRQAQLLGAAITASTEACLADAPEFPALLAIEEKLLAQMRVLCIRRHNADITLLTNQEAAAE